MYPQFRFTPFGTRSNCNSWNGSRPLGYPFLEDYAPSMTTELYIWLSPIGHETLKIEAWAWLYVVTYSTAGWRFISFLLSEANVRSSSYWLRKAIAWECAICVQKDNRLLRTKDLWHYNVSHAYSSTTNVKQETISAISRGDHSLPKWHH